MFHLLFSGPERTTAAFLADLAAAGYPAQITLQHGFPTEPLVDVVEALGDPILLDTAAELAARHGFTLRLHGTVEPPEIAAADDLEARLAQLEARIAALTEGDR